MLPSLRTSSDYRADSLALASYPAGGWEKQAELYYRYKVNSKFELTPDFQLIQRPAGIGGTQSIRVIGLRTKVGI
jgi:carbohydrate-selective porin OprB